MVAGKTRRMTDLAGFVLRDLVLGVLLAVLAFTVGAAGLWNVDLFTNPISIAPQHLEQTHLSNPQTCKRGLRSQGLLHGFLICSAARHLRQGFWLPPSR